VEIQRETTEYLYLGITGSVPATSAEVAFLAAAVRPEEADWETATIVDTDVHALWGDAVASGVTGDFYLARLVGSFNANDVVLTAGDYQVWLRLTDTAERPVRIAPVALEVL
jgi:hypothetical protein